MMLDGTAFHFADWTRGVGYRTGVREYPASGRVDELVSLGNRLAEYAGADASRRPALEAELVKQAEKLRTKF